ncbi:hypothetical protein GE09DRAFT_1055828 [Coniochaeta sp. 2T2.1]|nr:hypothetical protein GE09DRAFT_1055828 [Coniochaeta sp. 2T2.1]
MLTLASALRHVASIDSPSQGRQRHIQRPILLPIAQVNSGLAPKKWHVHINGFSVISPYLKVASPQAFANQPSVLPVFRHWRKDTSITKRACISIAVQALGDGEVENYLINREVACGETPSRSEQTLSFRQLNQCRLKDVPASGSTLSGGVLHAGSPRSSVVISRRPQRFYGHHLYRVRAFDIENDFRACP